MSTVINTNVLALNSHRNLKNVGKSNAKASERLSSGLRINSAADDAAGLAISEKMRAQIRGLDMASKNTQDATSLIQTAEGGMQEIDNMLQRVRELVVQSSNDTNENNTQGTGDRQKIQDEIDSLVGEIDSMSERVEFNKKKVINGSCEDPQQALDTASANYDRALAARGNGTTPGTLKSLDNAKLAYANDGSDTNNLKAGANDILAAFDKAKTAAKPLEQALATAQADFDTAKNDLDFDKLNKLLTDAGYDGFGAGETIDSIDSTKIANAFGGTAISANDLKNGSSVDSTGTSVGKDAAVAGATTAAALETAITNFATELNTAIGASTQGPKYDSLKALDDSGLLTKLSAFVNKQDALNTAQTAVDEFYNGQATTPAAKVANDEIEANRTDASGATYNLDPVNLSFADKADFDKQYKSAIDANNLAKNSMEDAQKADDKVVADMDKFTSQMQKAQSDIDALGGKEAGLYFQVGANAHQGLKVSIGSVNSFALGIGDGKGKTNIDVVKDSGADITGQLDALDEALSYVTTQRSRLGATQNRLEYTQKSLDISSENLSAAESRIRDADMAKEMMNKTQAGVLQQAATSMLAQANQAPQNVLQLIG